MNYSPEFTSQNKSWTGFHQELEGQFKSGVLVVSPGKNLSSSINYLKVSSSKDREICYA